MRLAASLIAIALSPAVARADFVMQAPPPAPSPPAPYAPARPFRPPPPRAAAVPVAAGFGRDVQLQVAVRQIVPPGIPVRYAEGVDPDQTVDWDGGRPWPDVLRAAVKPAGLRVAVAGGAVRIDPPRE